MSFAILLPAKISKQFLILAIFLVVIFLTGGSSREDETQVAFLYPISIAFCGLAITTLRWDHIRGNRTLVACLAALLALPLLYVFPSISSLQTVRPDAVDIDFLTYSSDRILYFWPLTPDGGVRALQTLVIPVTVILLAIQLSEKDRHNLLPLLIGLTSASGLLGFFQAIGDPNGTLYLYRFTNNGSAVGLFANRNHSATLLACLFPMLSIYASSQKNDKINRLNRKMTAAIVGSILIPLILITGSRAGLLMSIIGLGGAAVLYRGTKKRNAPHNIALNFDGRFVKIWIVLMASSLGLITILFSRAEAIERLLGKTYGESRGDFNAASIDMLWTYFPWGAGSGSFVQAYQIAEPLHLLDFSYLNRAHNDWLEVAATFGMPGVVFMAVAIIGYAWRSYHLWRFSEATNYSTMIGRMATIPIGIIALSSISDYPARTPIVLAFLAVLMVWVLEHKERPKDFQKGD